MKKITKRTSDRWSSVDTVVDNALHEMAEDEKELEHFYRECKRWKPEAFAKISLAQFEAWNNRRLADIDAAAEKDENQPERCGTLLMANKVLFALLQEMGGVPDKTLEILIPLKNELVKDFATNPSDTAARQIYDALKEQCDLTGCRPPGELSPAAIEALMDIQALCSKQKLAGQQWGKGGVFP